MIKKEIKADLSPFNLKDGEIRYAPACAVNVGGGITVAEVNASLGKVTLVDPFQDTTFDISFNMLKAIAVVIQEVEGG